MSKILVVTSFSQQGYELYGKKFLDSFAEHWPKEVELACYHHSEYPLKETLWDPSKELKETYKDYSNLNFFNLDLIKELVPFKNSCFNIIQARTGGGKVPWQLDAIKFTNKVFAIANANANAVEEQFDWIIWLDADTYTNKKVTLEDIHSWLEGDEDIVHLGRNTTYYSETSFLGFRVNRPRVRVFIDNFITLFLNGEFQFWQEWHDGFIFERLLNIHKLHGLKTKNLSEGVPDLQAFMFSPLSQWMTHLKGNLKNQVMNPPKAQKQALKIIPQDCVSQEHLKDNIKENLELISRWVCGARPNKEKVLFVSAGPSIKGYYKKIKKAKEEGKKIFCVKHSYPMLVENGIIPDFVVILDPREIDGVSTHGKVRKDLFSEVYPDKTTFLIASMTHPSVTKFFKDKGCKVVGWHAAIHELFQVLETRPDIDTKYKDAVTLGTCSAIRGVGLAHLLGFRDVELFGFDSSLEEPPANPKETRGNGELKYCLISLDGSGNFLPFTINQDDPPELEKNEVRFWTTGELVALYQDFLGCVPLFEKEMKLKINHGNTLIAEGWKRLNKINKLKELQIKEHKLKMLKAPSYKDVLG